MKLFLLGAFSALVLSALVGLVVVSSGIVSASALWEWGAMDDLLGYASRRSIAHHAKDASNPFRDDIAALAVGLDHYKDNCLACHAAPGFASSELAQGLNPLAPKLTTDRIQKMSDGELFWVVSNGIRMTGMPAFSPTHDEDEIWKMVAFVRHLKGLTDEEKAELGAGRADEMAHHDHHHVESSEPAHDEHKEEKGHAHDAGSETAHEQMQESGAGHEHHSHGAADRAPITSGTTDLEIVREQKASYPLMTCVISGDELGKKGEPVDYVVEGRLVRLCCKDCKKDVDKDPAGVFTKIDAAVVTAEKPGYPMNSDPITGEILGEGVIDYVYGTRLVRLANQNSIALFLKEPRTELAKVDKALIDAQRPSYPLDTCVVTEETLGSKAGGPIDYLYGTRLVRFCCQDCPPKFEQDPARYLFKIDEATKKGGK